MRAVVWLLVIIILIMTAPVWMPVLGAVALVGGIAALIGGVAANHAAPAPAPVPVERPAYVQTAPAPNRIITALDASARGASADQASERIVCAWVYDAQKCRTIDQWRERARIWCDRAAQSTARRQAMQAKGWGTNRLFMSPYGAEFAREGQAEAVVGTICAAEQGGLARRNGALKAWHGDNRALARQRSIKRRLSGRPFCLGLCARVMAAAAVTKARFSATNSEHGLGRATDVSLWLLSSQ